MLHGGLFFNVFDFEQFPFKNEFEKELIILESPCQKFSSSWDVSKSLLCGQQLMCIFISFSLTGLWLHPKPEGFVFSLEWGKTTFNSAMRSLNNFHMRCSRRILPSPVTAEHRTFCLDVPKVVRLRVCFFFLPGVTRIEKNPQKVNWRIYAVLQCLSVCYHLVGILTWIMSLYIDISKITCM